MTEALVDATLRAVRKYHPSILEASAKVDAASLESSNIASEKRADHDKMKELLADERNDIKEAVSKRFPDSVTGFTELGAERQREILAEFKQIAESGAKTSDGILVIKPETYHTITEWAESKKIINAEELKTTFAFAGQPLKTVAAAEIIAKPTEIETPKPVELKQEEPVVVKNEEPTISEHTEVKAETKESAAAHEPTVIPADHPNKSEYIGPGKRVNLEEYKAAKLEREHPAATSKEKSDRSIEVDRSPEKLKEQNLARKERKAAGVGKSTANHVHHEEAHAKKLVAQHTYVDKKDFVKQLDELKPNEIPKKKSYSMFNIKAWFTAVPKEHVVEAEKNLKTASEKVMAYHTSPQADALLKDAFPFTPGYFESFKQHKPEMLAGIAAKLTDPKEQHFSTQEVYYLNRATGKRFDDKALQEIRDKVKHNPVHKPLFEGAAAVHGKESEALNALNIAKTAKKAPKPAKETKAEAEIAIKEVEEAGKNWVQKHPGKTALIAAGGLTVGGWAANVLTHKNKTQEEPGRNAR